MPDPAPSPHLTRRRLLIGAAATALGALRAASGREADARPLTMPADRPLIEPDDARAAASLTVSAKPTPQPFRAEAFSMVGVFDVDWLTEPDFARLLDNLAASPGAFGAVRFFGALTSGTREKTTPTGSGIVWPDAAAPMDFSVTLAALDALVARGLTPFVQLGFFPAAVSPAPTLPPASFERWKALIRGFLDALVADPRFGAAAIRTWWFEVWNEPNNTIFWRGDFARYLDLYRATSEAVREAGYPLRLGGPALAYFPPSPDVPTATALMWTFLQFLSDAPDVQCDFISLHQKGTWNAREPTITDLTTAAAETATMMRDIAPDRFHGMPIINNEADMKVGFDTPYEPRMTEQFPSWLTSVMIAYDNLSARFGDAGPRFHAAADDANLQLVQATFDGRRSIMTRASAAASDLFKAPVANFYELLRLLGDQHGTVISGSEWYYPHSELFHTITVAAGHLAAIFTVYPLAATTARSWTVAYTITDLPWPVVNVARFQIDAGHSNAYTPAGRTLSVPYPDAAGAARIRRAQELALSAPIRHAVAVADGTFHDRFDLDLFTTALFWITPFDPTPPAAPRWITTAVENGNVILRWEPSRAPDFFSYAVSLLRDGQPETALSPMPLRAALWIDTAPPGGTRVYGVRTISASGIPSPFIISDPVSV